MSEARKVTLTIVLDEQGKPIATELDKITASVTKMEGASTTATGKMSKGFSMTAKEMALGAGAAMGFALSISAMTGFVKESVQAFTDEERQQARLNSILRQHGENVKAVSSEIDDFSDKMEYLTGIDGDQVKSLEILARQYDIQGDKIHEAIQGAIGLTQIGGTLESNLEALANAYNGNWQQLGRLIPELRSASTESERLEILQRKMAEGFDLSTASMKTNAGAIVELKNWWDDLQKKVGAFAVTAAHGLDAMNGNRRMAAEITRELITQQEAFAQKIKANMDALHAQSSIAPSKTRPTISGIDVESDLMTGYSADMKANEAIARQIEEITAQQKKRVEVEKPLSQILIERWKALNDNIAQDQAYAEFIRGKLGPAVESYSDAWGDNLDVAKLAQAEMDKLQPKLNEQANKMLGKNAPATREWTINWKDANEVLQFAQSMVAGLTDLLGSLGIELGATGDAALQAASGVGQIAAGVISKNPLQIIQGVTQALTGLINLFKGDGVGEAIERENDWMQLTKDQVEQIKELEKQYGDTHAATSDLLDQFISSADITTDSFDQWAERLHGILSDLDSGKMTLQQTQAQLGDAFDALISKAQELGTEGSASLISFYEDLAARGIQVAEVQDYINAKLEAGADAYADLKDLIDSSSVAQEVFGDISVPIFEEMLAYRKKLADNDDLVKSIQAATTMMVSLTDAQRIDQKQFDQFSISADKSFKALIKGGMTGSEAIKTMGPYLQRLQFLHEQYGFTIDGNTQKILDQAKKEGVVIENKKTDTETIIDLLGSIAKALGADIPDALNKTARAATDAFGKADKAAREFGADLDDLGNVTWNVSGRAQGDYSGRKISAASGFYSSALSQDTLIQAHRGEEVSIVPVGERGTRQMILNVTVMGGSSPAAAADNLIIALEDNVHGARTVVEKIAGRA